MYGYGNSMFLATNGILARANAGAPPTNTVAPVISGTQVVGSLLSATTGTWTGSPTPTFTYQWYRGATLISGATSSSYTLVQADAGNTSNITCQVTGTNGIGSATATSNTLAQIFDFDANAFITSASITDSTQKAATNKLTIDLKGYSIWTKMKAVYPIVGGTSTSNSYNLRNTTQYQISWNGSTTHNSNGVTFGFNGYANTNFSDSNLTIENSAIGVYSRTPGGISSYDFGLYNSSLGKGIWLRLRSTADDLRGGFQQTISSAEVQVGNINAQGFYIIGKNGNTTIKVYKNATEIISSAKANATAVGQNLYLGALNDNNSVFASQFSQRNWAFAFMSDGLSGTDVTNLTSIVNTFQTTLNRNV